MLVLEHVVFDSGVGEELEVRRISVGGTARYV